MNRVLATAIDNWFQFDSGSWSRARRHSKIQCRKNFVQGRYNSNEEMRKIWRSTVFFFWEARYAGRDKDERALHKFVSAVQGSWTLLNITEGLWMRPWECSSWIFVTGQHPTLSRPRLARFRPVHKKKVKAKLFFFSPPSLIVYIYRVEREGKLNAPIRMIPRFWRHTCALAFFFFNFVRNKNYYHDSKVTWRIQSILERRHPPEYRSAGFICFQGRASLCAAAPSFKVECQTCRR